MARGKEIRESFFLYSIQRQRTKRCHSSQQEMKKQTMSSKSWKKYALDPIICTGLSIGNVLSYLRIGQLVNEGLSIFADPG